MARHKQAKTIDQRQRQLRNAIWPDADKRVWDYQQSHGWLNIPRIMPVIMCILDSFSKGKPLAATYLDIWCRTYNNGFVTAAPQQMAECSGFSGERALHTWLARIKKLQELGFIEVEPRNGPVKYILVENPYTALRNLQNENKIHRKYWLLLLERMDQIGADDLAEPSPAESETPFEEESHT